MNSRYTHSVSVPWISTGRFRDLRIWLLDNVHCDDYMFEGSDFNNLDNRIFYFAKECDAVLFALTWK